MFSPEHFPSSLQLWTNNIYSLNSEVKLSLLCPCSCFLQKNFLISTSVKDLANSSASVLKDQSILCQSMGLRQNIETSGPPWHFFPDSGKLSGVRKVSISKESIFLFILFIIFSSLPCTKGYHGWESRVWGYAFESYYQSRSGNWILPLKEKWAWEILASRP